MYADQVAAGAKRSLRDRLNGNVGDEYARPRLALGKRQRQFDDKWEHDLFNEEDKSQVSNPKIGSKDLRLKLLRKGTQQTYQRGSASLGGVHDLRDKLSGTMHSQPANANAPKSKQVSEIIRPAKKTTAVNSSVSEVKQVAVPASSKKKTQQKVDKNTVDGLLQSLGLEKYLITFKAEEIDMTALLHMSDEDLKALGIPMGPRKKILLALDPRA
ncbi:hypothetical protein H6P81_014048 [Aristolochia fimbriata]|uniref:SAM domain-containing protein n=1 Tax=Aristolochia fimbriata TaxID=158543 RepID=A0AAV7EGE2_ARIFI|nr:hypothetical protein H6P81_014048 [Aristolochia fimbriata]